MVHDRRTHDPAFWTHRNVDCDYSSAYVTLKTSSPDLRGVGMTFTIGRGNDIVRSNSSLCWGMYKRPLRHRFAKRSTMWRIVLLVRKSRTSSPIWARHGHTLPQIHNSAGTKSLLPRPPVREFTKICDRCCQDWSRKGCHPHRHRCRWKCRLGYVCQIQVETVVETHCGYDARTRLSLAAR